MSAVMASSSWPASHGTISEESIRRLHRPNYRHRFSVQKYSAGTEFPGARRVSTCYVLSGACEFAFGDENLTLEAEQVAVLPAGDYTFRVVGPTQVHSVSVFELPFDVVHHRRDGIEYLEDNGIYATSRDWAFGKTIVACQFPDDHCGITVWKETLCLAPEAGGWFVQDLAQPRADRRSFPNLKAACDHVIAAWLEPGWRRLGRAEAKRLLARSRLSNLTGPRETEEGDELKYVLNAYIREELRVLGQEVIIEGEMEHGGLCPCCEYLAIDPGEDGMWDICPVCFWENGGDGPNHMTLADAKRNFERLGAIDERSLEHVAPDRKRKYRRGYP